MHEKQQILKAYFRDTVVTYEGWMSKDSMLEVKIEAEQIYPGLHLVKEMP